MDDNKGAQQWDTNTFGEQRHNLESYSRLTGLNKVLILEDDSDFANIVREFFESIGFSVVYAKDGVEGVKRLINEDFSIILCDMLMPNLAGDMFYKAVERVKPHLCKRFIFMTGHQKDPKINEFIREVRGVMIWKPFKMHILHEAVQAIGRKYGFNPTK